MLVWEVMIDGFDEFYYYYDQYPTKRRIEYDEMDELRQNGRLNQRAALSVESVLRHAHHAEDDNTQLRFLILSTLRSVLDKDPAKRPSAHELLNHMDSPRLGRYDSPP
jgi:hypothetical protein